MNDIVPITALSPLAALQWQVEAGADEAISTEAGLQHWPKTMPSLTRPATDQPSVAPIPLTLPSNPPPRLIPTPLHQSSLSPPPQVQASSLEGLQAELAAFTGCPLRDTASNLVFCDGNPAARILLLGEAPGADEDRQGKPFAGANGALLDQMLGAIGLSRDTVFISNVIYWRPPGNRTPTEAELATCWPFCARTISLVQPKLLIFMGQMAAKAGLRTPDSLAKLRGRWHSYQPEDTNQPTIPSMVMASPAYLLRQPQAKRQAWNDLIQIKKHLQETKLLNPQ